MPDAFGGLLLLGGRLSDLFGAKRLFTAGWVVLAAGSLAAGLADSTGVEIGARAILTRGETTAASGENRRPPAGRTDSRERGEHPTFQVTNTVSMLRDLLGGGG